MSASSEAGLRALPNEWRARPHRVAIPYEIQQVTGNLGALVEAITLAVHKCADELDAALAKEARDAAKETK